MSPLTLLPGGEKLYEFFDPVKLAAAMETNDFGVEEGVGVLVDIIKTSTNPWAQIAALKVLRENAKDALQMAGAIGTVTGKITSDETGKRIEAETQSLRLLSRTAESSAKVLATKTALPVLVEDPNEEEDHNDGNRRDNGDPCPEHKAEHMPPQAGPSKGGLQLSQPGAGPVGIWDGSGNLEEAGREGTPPVHPSVGVPEQCSAMEPVGGAGSEAISTSDNGETP